MNESENFKFELVEEVAIPCATCFWGGAGLVAVAVVAAT